MELTNLTAKDVFLPLTTESKAGVVVPASGTKDVSDLLRGDPAILAAVAASLISVTAFDTADTSGVAQPEVVQLAAAPGANPTIAVAAAVAGAQPAIVHNFGYDPIVQIIDSGGVVVPGTSITHTTGVSFIVDTTGVASPATIIYR